MSCVLLVRSNMMEIRVLMELIVSAVSKKFYTSLAGVDYMVGTIVEDRRFEVMLMELRRPPKRDGCCGRKRHHDVHEEEHEDVSSGKGSGDDVEQAAVISRPLPQMENSGCFGGKKVVSVSTPQQERDQLQAVFANRRLRLDDLCKLMYVDEDKSFAKNKEVGMAAVRQMRSDAWAAVKKRFEKTPAGFLTVTVHEAHGLVTTEMSHMPNAFVSLEFEQLSSEEMNTQQQQMHVQTSTWETAVRPLSDAPVWDSDETTDNNQFCIPVWDLTQPKLYLHVYDSTSGLRDDTFIGEACYSSAAILDLMAQAGHSRERETLPLTRCTQSSKLGKRRFDKECSADGRQITVSVRYDFPQLALGTLHLQVKSAAELLAADSNGCSDPFAVVTVTQTRDAEQEVQRFVTKTINKSLNPVWGESFFFDIWERGAQLTVDVYDADFSSDDYLGQAAVDLRNYCDGSPQVGALELELTPCEPDRDMPEKVLAITSVSGSIHLELKFDQDRSRLDIASASSLGSEAGTASRSGGARAAADRLAERLEEVMERNDLSEAQRAKMREGLTDEAKLQFIASMGLLRRSQLPSRGSIASPSGTGTPPRASMRLPPPPLATRPESARSRNGSISRTPPRLRAAPDAVAPLPNNLAPPPRHERARDFGEPLVAVPRPTTSTIRVPARRPSARNLPALPEQRP